MNCPTITRKEIAAEIRKSVKTVTRREREWELHKCRSNAGQRPVEYFTTRARNMLRLHHVLAEDD